MINVNPTLTFKPSAMSDALKSLIEKKGLDLTPAEVEDWSAENSKRIRAICRHVSQLSQTVGLQKQVRWSTAAAAPMSMLVLMDGGHQLQP